MGGSTSHIALRFAAISVMALTVIAGQAAATGYWMTGNAEKAAAARAADRLVGTAVRNALETDGASPETGLSASAQARLDGLAASLRSPDLRSIRLWAPDGQVAYEAGGDRAAGRPSAVNGGEPGSARGTAADGTPIFSAYTPAAGYVLEIAQDARPIDARTNAAQKQGILIVAITYVVLALTLQAGFWLATRKVASEHRRLVRLHTSGEELRSSLDLHDVITRVSREATALARADYSLVALFEADTGDLVLRATFDGTTDTVAHQQRSIEEWFLRRAVITNTTIVSGQPARSYVQFFGSGLDAYEQVNVMVVPMSLRDRVVGVLAVIRVPSGRRAAFTGTDVTQTVDLAAQGAVAVEQALLFAKVRSYAKEVELSYDSTLKAMMAALEAKDDVSEGRGERAAKLTVQLARQMGITDAALLDIERGALLHDVGKIGVPDAVLKKPAALNEGEWEAMRKHPLLAGMMISKVGFLEGATPILLYHHERFDGAGYPFGLQGDKIPLDARIFSVVDAYEAMTVDRPYRDALTHDQAMAEIAAGSGSQFDPAVVVAFGDLIAARPELRTRPAAAPRDRNTYHSDDLAAHASEPDSSAA